MNVLMFHSLGWAAQSQLGDKNNSLMLEGVERCWQTQSEAEAKGKPPTGSKAEPAPTTSREAGLHQLSWSTRKVS